MTPTKKTATKTETISINYNGATISVDLNSMCPPELFKKLKDVSDKNRAMYIPAPLVREIIRGRGGIQVIKEELKQPILGSSTAILMAEVIVSVDGDLFSGTGLDCMSLKKLAAAGMGQGGHVAALALKSALKKRFKFFEGDYASAEIEDATFEEVNMDELVNEIEKVIEPTPTPVEVTPPAPVVEVPVATPVPPAVIESPAPVVQEPTTEVVVTPPPVPTPAPVEVAPIAAPSNNALEKFEYLLHQSREQGNNSLNTMQEIGKAIVAEYNIVKGSDDHTALLAKASQLMEWFTATK